MKTILIAFLVIAAVGFLLFARQEPEPKSVNLAPVVDGNTTIAAKVADNPKAAALDDGPVIPTSGLDDKALAFAPALQNNGESDCADKEYNSHPCTEEEFAEVRVEVQRQWDSYPEWLRKRCVLFTTIRSLSKCEVTEAVAYLNTHPGEKAPWTGIPPVE